MRSKQEIRQGIIDICNEIISSKFIMFNIGLTKLLKFIVENKSLFEYVKDCNVVIDYRKEFHSATNALESSSKFFKLPIDNRSRVVLITGVLFDIDRKELDILSFLHDYFDGRDINERYVDFIQRMIIPYKSAFDEFVSMTTARINVQESAAAPIADNTDFSIMSEQLLPYIETVYAEVYGDNKLSDERRADMITMIEGICYALEKENTVLLGYMWIGFKNTFANYSGAIRFVKGMANLLKTYNVLKGV